MQSPTSTPTTLVILRHILLITLLSASTLSGETILLVDRFDDVGFVADDCIGAVPNDCSLRGAISLANSLPPGEEIVIELDQGIYGLTLAGDGEDGNGIGDLDAVRGFTLRGQGRGLTAIISDGGFDDGLFEVHGLGTAVVFESLMFAFSQPANGRYAVSIRQGNTANFQDVTFRSNGTLASGGGGLFLESESEALLENCELVAGRAGIDGGGAILSRAASLTIRDSRIADNWSAGSGGALRLRSPLAGGPSIVLIERTTLVDNRATEGGGILAETDTELTVVDSTFESNRAEGPCACTPDGGAIYTSGDLTVNTSTFVDNRAGAAGAAITARDAGLPLPIVDLFNVTITTHQDPSSTESIYLENTTAEILNVTFYGNDLDIETNQADLTLTNNLFGAGCTLVLGNLITNGGNVALDGSCWDGVPAAGDQEVGTLRLEPLGNYGGPTRTHRPTSDSTALDSAIACAPTDQRGYTRPPADCDSGAVELLDPDPAVFYDGFETGNTSRWFVAPS